MELQDTATNLHAHLVADWVELAAAGDADGRATGDLLVNAREELTDRGGGNKTPTKVDAWQREAEDVFALLRDRAARYGAGYPFKVSDDVLELRTVALDELRVTYCFLLAAASLSAFEKGDRHLLTGGL